MQLWNQTSQEHAHYSTIKSVNELIDVSMNKLVIVVGEELLNGNALLLPDVHDLFSSFAAELSENLHVNDNIDSAKLITSL